jgi:DNA-binding transcriptional LysR family regulator
MNKFEAIRIFAKVVENHGFTAAGRELGLSRSAVSKYVTQLEDSLGAQLLNRSTRFVSPTETGAAFYDRSIAILADLNEAERDVAELQGEPRGSIRLNAPMSFGTIHLASAIADFIAAYPEVRVETVLNDRFIDPVQEGFDLTIRIADLPDSSLIARKIAPAKRILCAAPDYLRDKGAPSHPVDLKYHSCLHYGYLPTGNTWRFEGDKGRHSVLINGVLCSNNGEFLMASAVKGLGIALLPSFIVGAELQAGRLVSVLTDYQMPEIAIYAIYPPNRHLSAKIRLLIDFLAARFGDTPYWDLVS